MNQKLIGRYGLDIGHLAYGSKGVQEPGRLGAIADDQFHSKKGYRTTFPTVDDYYVRQKRKGHRLSYGMGEARLAADWLCRSDQTVSTYFC